MADQLSSDLASLRIDRGEPRRARWPKVLLTLLLLGGAAFAGYAYGLPYLEGQVFKTEIEVTEIVMVSPAQAQVSLTATGYIVPQTTSEVASKVPGRIAKVFVAQGDHVKAGDV
ncbi:MAG TPA: biotin/lipoyl-binding protein, partial [Polyangiaceae bacterium]